MSKTSRINAIKNKIGIYPDFPKVGISFKDILPVLKHPDTFIDVISLFEEFINEQNIKIDCVVGIEARGFLLGPALALKLNLPFVPIRKPGKLAGKIEKESYELEYGVDSVEIQADTITEEMKNIVLVDDLLATGGTMEASVKLIQKLGGTVKLCITVIELTELKGRDKVPVPVHSLIQYKI